VAKVEQTVTMNASAERIMEVISGYEHYPDFLPEIRRVDVRSREKDTCVVLFEVQLIMRVAYTLRLVKKSQSHLEWELVDSKLMTVNAGHWKLEPAEDGTTLVTYGLELELAGKLPASVNRRMAAEALPETLARFKSRVENA
jgi:ribosome-associated toxin RatA of RatAB toxin-antitoxin module